jgi:hypothetical protein
MLIDGLSDEQIEKLIDGMIAVADARFERACSRRWWSW